MGNTDPKSWALTKIDPYPSGKNLDLGGPKLEWSETQLVAAFPPHQPQKGALPSGAEMVLRLRRSCLSSKKGGEAENRPHLSLKNLPSSHIQLP